MKKYILLTAMAVMAAFACNKVEPQAEEPTTYTYKFTIADKPSFDGQTRAVKTSWENGDKIYVVFDDQTPTALTDFLILQYDGSQWNVAQQPSAGNQPKEEGGTLDALYYANPNPTSGASGSEFLFNNDTSTAGQYLFTWANSVEYTISDGSLEASLDLVFPGDTWNYFVQFCITGINEKWSVTLPSNFARVSPVWKSNAYSYQTIRTSNYNKPSINGSDGYFYTIIGSSKAAGPFTFSMRYRDGTIDHSYSKTFTKGLNGPAAIKFSAPSEDVDVDETTTNGWKRTY